MVSYRVNMVRLTPRAGVLLLATVTVLGPHFRCHGLTAEDDLDTLQMQKTGSRLATNSQDDPLFLKTTGKFLKFFENIRSHGSSTHAHSLKDLLSPSFEQGRTKRQQVPWDEKTVERLMKGDHVTAADARMFYYLLSALQSGGQTQGWLLSALENLETGDESASSTVHRRFDGTREIDDSKNIKIAPAGW